MSSQDVFYEKVGTSTAPARKKSLKSRTAPPQEAYASDGEQNIFHGLERAAVPAVSGARRWSQTESGAYFGTLNTVEQIPAGMYSCGFSNTVGFYLNEQKLETDSLLELPDAASNKIIAEFETFWGLAPEFASRGFLMKRGYLLWGPPGSGKSTTINILIRKLIDEHNGIVILGACDPALTSGCLTMARKIEGERPIVVILEDIDALVDKHGEQHFLALLDGESQVNNIVSVATTNYPERLDRRFVDRPSRFDTIQYVGMPSAAARRVYLRTKEPSLNESELAEWVKLSKGFSVAHLKEMIIAVRCFKQPLADVVKRLEKMHERKPTSEDSPDREGMGMIPTFPLNGSDIDVC